MDYRSARPRAWYGVAVVVAATLVLVARSSVAPRTPRALRDCTAITVVSSSEKAGLLTETRGRDYARPERRVRGRLRAGHRGREVLGRRRQHAGGGVGRDGRRPRADGLDPRHEQLAGDRPRAPGRTRTGPALIPDEVGHVATSPLVIAMPRPMAEAMGWPDRPHRVARPVRPGHRTRTGGPATATPSGAPFKLGKTNPNFSTSGLNALIGEYYAATGTSSDLTVDAIRDPAVVRFVRGVESSVVHYGDISITFLENLRRADDSRPRPDLRLGRRDRGEVGLGLQPGEPERRPGDARAAPAPTTRSSPSTPTRGRW